jgi:ComF family protein
MSTLGCFKVEGMLSFQALQRSARYCLDIVLPPRCLGCGGVVDSEETLCAQCWRKLTFLGSPCCRHCGYPLPQAVVNSPICGACTIELPTYDRARAALRYDDGAKGMILRFKHADRTDIAGMFGRLLKQAGDALLQDCDLIVPVPLHRWRLLQRGYNQSALLARALADGSDRPMLPDLLQRVQATASQQGLTGQQRRQNIRASAFRVHPWYRERILEKRVLLIDDVLTTGSTIDACARTLRHGGASAVDVLTIARVVKDYSNTISTEDVTSWSLDDETLKPERKHKSDA